MSYNIEVLAIKEELYSGILQACESLNKVQGEFRFEIPSPTLRRSLFIQQRERYLSDDAFDWIRDYRREAMGHRPFTILVVDGFLSSSKLSNLFGTHKADEGLAVFTIYDFNQFVNDITRYCRYYLVRYAISFVAPEIKSHNDSSRKGCIFHKKISKAEIKFSLNSGQICPECMDKLRVRITNDIRSSIDKLLQVVSNQHPYSLVIKGGGVKGLAFAGALLELESHFSFDTFAGTSAGAIAAVLLGAGYKPKELLEILRDKDFEDFKDAPWYSAAINFVTKSGLYPGDAFENWLDDLLKRKFPEKLKDVALQDLAAHTILYSSRIKDGTIVFDSKADRKEALAAFAARCSMSIPYFFIPAKVDGTRVYDGGVRNNFPLRLFMETYPSKPVIALYLVSASKRGGLAIGEIIDIATDGEEMSIVEKNLDKVVVIDPRPVKTKDFNLSNEKKEFLVLRGQLGALKYLERNHKDIPVDKSRVTFIVERIEELRKRF